MVSIAQSVRDLLAAIGPLTSREVADYLGISHRVAANTLCHMRAAATRTAYIESWTRDGPGKEYPRPQWMVGDKPDAKKPPRRKNSQKCREWREQVRGRVPSVFHLGGML